MKVLVVGAGVFGTWSAWFLSQAGHRVMLVDAYGPANPRASSADHSRVIRSGYGGDTIYSDWARESLTDWRWLSQETDRELFVPSGALFMGAPGDEYVETTFRMLRERHIGCELLNAEALSARFPQIDSCGLGWSVFEVDAGILRARRAVQALLGVTRAQHDVIYGVARLAPIDESDRKPTFRLATGEQLSAEAYVCAAGPWLPGLLPSAVGRRIRVTRQEVLLFGVPAGDKRFAVPYLPVWIDFPSGVYGIPSIDARGFKVGIDRHGPPIDPDIAERIVDRDIVDRTRQWLAMRFPKLADAPLVDSHVCQYENTSTGDFIIDRHPNWSNVWIVGGGSGHGFKHGPAVGRHVAALVTGRAEVHPRFTLATKSVTPKRAVY